MKKRRVTERTALFLGLVLGLTLPGVATAADPHAGHQAPASKQGTSKKGAAADPHGGHKASGEAAAAADPHAGHTGSQALPALPQGLPAWLDNKERNHIFYQRGPYNFDIYNVEPLARDLNAVAVGHAMAYEDLVTGKAAGLETKTFERINRVLKNPPRLMPDEAAISPTFGRKYGVLEQVFDWTHILHAQTADVLASTKLTEVEKERETERLWRYYSESVPYAITGLPLHMGYLDSQPYSKAFRQKYPKVNGLFWGYHWLQGSMYDLLYGKSLEEQRRAYEPMQQRYHQVELYRTDRGFMPMFAEVSPRYAKRFPQIANAFDNLHMLHDLVNDILATDGMSEEEQERQIKRAIWIVSAQAHRGEKPGDVQELNGLHDHRFMPGMPGMGMMPAGHEHGTHEGHSVPKEGRDKAHEHPAAQPQGEHEGHSH